jgi:hypothetical protein
MATSALLTKMNRGDVDLLSIHDGTQAEKDQARDMLARDFGVRSRKQLLEAIEELKETGHSKSFSEFLALPPESVQIWRDIHAPGTRGRQRIEDVLEYGPRFGDRKLKAWDLGRAVNLCRNGYLIGFFTEEEAWACVFENAATIQKTFRSWQEFGTNYTLGRRHWNVNVYNAAHVDWLYRRLLAEPSSPWRELPWDLDLRPGAKAPLGRPASIETYASLQLASHPGRLTCFRLTVYDRHEPIPLLPQFAQAFGCEIGNIKEQRDGRDSTLAGDCYSPFNIPGAITTTKLPLEGVFAQLRKVGVSQVFLTWDHPPAEFSELTPAAYHHWEDQGRAYEERHFYIDKPTLPLKLSYGAKVTYPLHVMPSGWWQLAATMLISALFGIRHPWTQVTRRHSAFVHALFHFLSAAIWAVWPVIVILSNGVFTLSQSLDIGGLGTVIALLLFCLPAWIATAVCFSLLGEYHRRWNRQITRWSYVKLGLAIGAVRAVWPAMVMFWFSGGPDRISSIGAILSVMMALIVEKMLFEVHRRAVGRELGEAPPPALVERAAALAMKAKIRLKGIRIVRIGRPGAISAYAETRGWIYLPESFLQALSVKEVDACIAQQLQALRHARTIEIARPLVVGAFWICIAMSPTSTRSLALLIGLCAFIRFYQARLSIRAQTAIDVQASKLLEDPHAVARSIVKVAIVNGLSTQWGLALALALGQPSPESRTRKLVGLTGIEDESNPLTYAGVPPELTSVEAIA